MRLFTTATKAASRANGVAFLSAVFASFCSETAEITPIGLFLFGDGRQSTILPTNCGLFAIC